MITPKEIQAKTEKAFFKVVSAYLKGENLFPWTVPSNKQITGTNYNEWKADLLPLHQQSKNARNKGYTVEWKPKLVNGTKQSVPSKIYYETLDDFLFFIGRTTDYKKIEAANDLIVKTFPDLKEWAANNPAIILEHSQEWDELLSVCIYFVQHPPPHSFFIRELPIPVHSKFIEQNGTLLRKLLDLLLPQDWINSKENDFASRFGLKKLGVYTQIRILDDALKPYLGFDECSLTLDDAGWLKWSPQKVFIIENQVCFHTFPKVKNAVAIFGEGFKSRVSRHLPWLEKTDLYCWFDLDAAGFEMLNMIRQHYSNAKNFLMDEGTFKDFQVFAVQPERRQNSRHLELLTDKEQVLYQNIVTYNWRLEQERLSHAHVQSRLNELYPSIEPDQTNNITITT
jgi:hypothetical protein